MLNDTEITHLDAAHPASGRKIQSGNLILVGMMGSGKTTMGHALARQLGMAFVDSDEEVVKRTGVNITHIFDVEGEQGFRQRETAVISDLVGREKLVLATGGGAVLNEQNCALLQQNGIVIYLKASVQDLWQRTRHDRNRPLLQLEDPEAKLLELFQQRDPIYQGISDIVATTGKQSANSLMLRLTQEIDAFRARQKPE